MKRSIKDVSAQRMEQYRVHNLRCLYVWACTMMGIDPTNNPNYQSKEDKILISTLTID